MNLKGNAFKLESMLNKEKEREVKEWTNQNIELPIEMSSNFLH